MKMKIVALLFLSASAVFSQPLFYSQSLQKLYYSLPSECRIENPVADSVTSCSGIIRNMTVPVVYGMDSYGILAHLGYPFLPAGMDMSAFHPAVVRFLERELLALLVTDDLEQKLISNRENDFVILHNGSIPRQSFYRDTNGLPFLLQHVSGMNISYLEKRRYEVRLDCGPGQSLKFEFVADAELLSDMDKKERDERVAAQLSHHRPMSSSAPLHVPECDSQTMQTYQDSAYVCRGRSYVIPQINNNLYYLKTDDTFSLVFSNKWAAETLSNVLLSSAVGYDYVLQITHRQYGGTSFQYEVKSRTFFDYFSGNYDRYFGIESLERDMLSGTLILADRNTGSIHLAHVSVNLWDLINGGNMKIQLESNIPQHNVETLFGKKGDKTDVMYKLSIP